MTKERGKKEEKAADRGRKIVIKQGNQNHDGRNEIMSLASVWNDKWGNRNNAKHEPFKLAYHYSPRLFLCNLFKTKWVSKPFDSSTYFVSFIVHKTLVQKWFLGIYHG